MNASPHSQTTLGEDRELKESALFVAAHNSDKKPIKRAHTHAVFLPESLPQGEVEVEIWACEFPSRTVGTLRVNFDPAGLNTQGVVSVRLRFLNAQGQRIDAAYPGGINLDGPAGFSGMHGETEAWVRTSTFELAANTYHEAVSIEVLMFARFQAL